MGIPLFRIPDIRRFYGEEPFGHMAIDFDEAAPTAPYGHVIAVRITSENPDEGFKPTSGGIQELVFRNTPDVWGYFSVGPSGGVHEYADSQFGHLFGWGPDREAARKTMCLALKELSIRGDIRTTVEYLIELLETDAFKKNHLDTAWLDSLIADNVVSKKPNTWLALICGAIYRAHNHYMSQVQQYIGYMERGLYPPHDLLSVGHNVELIYSDHKYNLQMTLANPNLYKISMGNHHIHAGFRVLNDGGYLVMVDGRSQVAYGKEEATGLRLTVDGKTCIFTKEYDPTQLRTNVAGKLIRYLVPSESHVHKGDSYAEMEVMKMCLPLVAPESGVLTTHKNEGAILEAGDLIATLQLDDPSTVRRSIAYTGKLPTMKEPGVVGDKPHHVLRSSLARIKFVLSGYGDAIDFEEAFLKPLYDLNLPMLEFQEVLSVIEGRIPSQVNDKLHTLFGQVTADSIKGENTHAGETLSKGTLQILEEHASTLPINLAETFWMCVKDLRAVAERFQGGVESNAMGIIANLLQDYMAVEQLFSNRRVEDVMDELRSQHKNDLTAVVDIIRAHRHVTDRNKLVVGLLKHIEKKDWVANFIAIFHELVALSANENADIALRARQMLVHHQFPSFEKRKAELEEHLRLTSAVTPKEREQRLKTLIADTLETYDVLVTFFHHPNVGVQESAMRIYIGRAYCAYDIIGMDFQFAHNQAMATWDFRLIENTRINAARYDSTANPLLRSKSRGFFDSNDRLDQLNGASPLRRGVMTIFSTIGEFYEHFAHVIAKCNEKPDVAKNANVINNVVNVAVTWEGAWVEDQCFVDQVTEFLRSRKAELIEASVSMVTLIVLTESALPYYYTFRHRLEYGEDPVYRHIEPSLAFLLDLQRLSNFDITFYPTDNREIHIYYGEAKSQGPVNPATVDRRFFVRSVIRSATFFDTQAPTVIAPPECERIIIDSLDALEVATGSGKFPKVGFSQIFLNILPDLAVEARHIEKVILALVNRYVERFTKLRVGSCELSVNLKPEGQEQSRRYRMVASNKQGQLLRIQTYVEEEDALTHEMVLKSVGEEEGELHDTNANLPYPVISALDRKRMLASSHDTTYCYDYPKLFMDAVKDIWAHMRPNEIVKGMFDSVELVLDDESPGGLKESSRNPGQNDVGMIAWRICIKTPECPDGRELICIANDITFQNGSFGTREDLLFKRASQYSRKHGLPRIYLTANSGARIGIADEVKQKFKVAWSDDADPTKGFEYLYLTDEDYSKLSGSSVNAKEHITEEGDRHWVITDIIGLKNDLGVENLRGSGMIAGETSKACEEIFTVTYVTGRTVGIGAYLARLGQRVIQKVGSPIILTGFTALNNLLGREVYLSNQQLGGTRIMHSNGVSYSTVTSDIGGIKDILKWLSYIPARKGEAPPVLPITDPVDRTVDFFPPKTAYDPRHMISGVQSDDGHWVSGFFDRDSFTEVLAGWAKTVVVGRARLGGIPLGVIAVETRISETSVPADPGNPESKEEVLMQPGQVWYPDSAFKTAQAISDFSREGVPLMVFANWRGFSGGTRDMFDQVLKFGSYIVDNLRSYKQPCFMYIPPNGELRGGSWVVVDPTINEYNMMEMYADEESRGGVLEPNGTISIKYKKKDQLLTMNRVDPLLNALNEQLQSAQDSDVKNKIRLEIKAREDELLPVYQQIAIQFADLHDTPGRMLAKGVIHGVQAWKRSREWFYWRLRRRVTETRLQNRLMEANPEMSTQDAVGLIRSKIMARLGNDQSVYEDNEKVALLLDESKDKIEEMLSSATASHHVNLEALAKSNPEALVKALLSATGRKVETASLNKLLTHMHKYADTIEPMSSSEYATSEEEEEEEE
eukprot:GFYU01001751.1.p1 GENE.GFYU01001751.1~~GFYU01001751.1.p1  ORF type:complete len:1896 (-),score=731.34 GFYU01001751.1:229-5760(-)